MGKRTQRRNRQQRKWRPCKTRRRQSWTRRIFHWDPSPFWRTRRKACNRYTSASLQRAKRGGRPVILKNHDEKPRSDMKWRPAAERWTRNKQRDLAKPQSTLYKTQDPRFPLQSRTWHPQNRQILARYQKFPTQMWIVMGKFGSEPWSEPELDRTGPYFRFRFGLWSRTGPTVLFEVQQVPSPCWTHSNGVRTRTVG